MKKQYMKPTQEVVTVSITHHLMDPSPPSAGLNLDEDVDAGDLDSRRASDWDDEY